MNTRYDGFLRILPKDWTFDRMKDVVIHRNEKTNSASSEEDYLELEDLESGTGLPSTELGVLPEPSRVAIWRPGRRPPILGRWGATTDPTYKRGTSGKICIPPQDLFGEGQARGRLPWGMAATELQSSSRDAAHTVSAHE